MIGIPKPPPHALTKRARVADLAQQDREENAKVRQRSGGMCEVFVMLAQPIDTPDGPLVARRCHHRAFEIHHLIGGSGRRNKGKSILATHKLHVCNSGLNGCHRLITDRILKPVGTVEQREAASTVRYERRVT